jgi:hypothetical protein
MLVRLLSENPAQFVDHLREVAFLDYDLRPYRADQDGFVEDLASMLD